MDIEQHILDAVFKSVLLFNRFKQDRETRVGALRFRIRPLSEVFK